ncbi:copper chaperone [Caviibacterium pharyngocola]|uniref:Copper chaperone n=2 Tax=Caviibacterium pharyngocola TaxID=28159 RepID=A0A2M8RWA5_9PAST|nr:heavy-metal-associated domain-containing protein [Caviibacterium pharyngocola]PJG83153.1 copper chaperone [Caviibacterium pharyngocola]
MSALLLLSYSGFAAAETEKHLKLQIPEMTCQLCAYLVNKELRMIEGVISTKADIKSHSVNVIALNSLNNQRLIDAIEKLHYTAEITETE